MKRGTSICAAAILTGALFAVGLVARGAQDNQTGPPGQPVIGQQNEVPHGTVTDEQRADILMARKQYTEAIASYSSLIKNSSASPQNKAEVAGLWNKMGICYQQELDYGKARKAYKEAIKSDRQFAPAWNNLGSSFYLEHRPKKSIKYYRHAIKLNPDSASFHMNLGTAYFARKKFKPAFQEYRTAIGLDPEILTRTSRRGTSVETRFADARFYFYMAKIYASFGKPNEAVNYLRRAMEEGFTKRKEILDDPDILKISKDPGFIALMKNPPVAIKD
jgi:tetratricopeptide (TPR) repeat protein